MKKNFLLFSLFNLLFLSSFGQNTWQWGKRGDSSDIGGGGPGAQDEKVVNMTTDQHGNVYMASLIMQTGANVDGHAVAAWGGSDLIISSFTCDGTYRWSKTIGTYQDESTLINIKTDTLGGVYVSGAIVPHFITVHIDADSTWFTGSFNKSFFLAKFDTAGTYKWFRMPQPDTPSMSAFSYTAAMDMDVDGGGNIHMLCELYPGAYALGAYIVPFIGYHMLVYDKNGNFVSGYPMDISPPLSYGTPLFKMKRDFWNGRTYITGTKPYGSSFSFGSFPITHYMYVGCFNSFGNLIWQRQDDTTFGGSFGRVALDDSGNIYLTCGVGNGDVFNGYTIVNTLTSIPTAGPVAIKMDSAGNNKWGRYGSTKSVAGGEAITLNGDIVTITGEYTGKVNWPGYPDSLNKAPGGGDRIFITSFNAHTGAVIGLDSIGCPGGVINEALNIVSDKFGNFYIGGDFNSDFYFHGLTMPGDTLHYMGGGSDFYIAKYGTSNCSVPITLKATQPAQVAKTLWIYPNPATNELTIENAGEGTTIRLFNIMGQQVYSGITSNDKQGIAMTGLVPGTYLLQLTDKNGNRTTQTVVKQ